MDLTGALASRMHTAPLTAASLLFVAGILGTFGPCGAQRMLGFVAVMKTRRAAGTAALYACGIFAASLTLILGSSALVSLAAATRTVNVCMALACIAVGAGGLWMNSSPACARHAGTPRISGVGALALGFGSATFTAPCCAPFLFFIVACAPAGGLVYDALAFSAGATVPYLLAGCGIQRLSGLLDRERVRQPLHIVTSAVALALGFLYLVEV